MPGAGTGGPLTSISSSSRHEGQALPASCLYLERQRLVWANSHREAVAGPGSNPDPSVQSLHPPLTTMLHLIATIKYQNSGWQKITFYP